MSAGRRVAAAARAMVGVRFRLHGRGGATGGVDCVGLAAAALRGGGFAGAVPDDYPLRGGDPDGVMRRIDAVLARAEGMSRAGDLLLFRAGPGQLHLAIATENGLVHADAGLRRVVERPRTAPWPLVAAWRLRDGAGEG